MNHEDYMNIPQEKFVLANASDTPITDKKLDTKSMSYFADAFSRFRKNKASVVATIIIILIILYALIIPIVCSGPQTEIMDSNYRQKPARLVWMKENFGIMDGSTSNNYNQRGMIVEYAKGVAAMTIDEEISIKDSLDNKYQPVVKINSIQQLPQGLVYNARVDQYLSVGFIYDYVTEDELAAIKQWEVDNGEKLLYPLIANNEYCLNISNANYWYKTIGKGVPVRVTQDADGDDVVTQIKLDEDLGNIVLQDNYLRDANGDFVYTENTSSDAAVQYKVRLLYYNYYRFSNGVEPDYLLGTDKQGYDLAYRMAEGIQLSLLLAICVSLINFVIGAIYGAVAGYYGGTIDLVMERITDILSGVPFVIVATLFQIHLTNTGKVGPVTSLIFAFVLTGWIGTAARVRTQFYRFKNQEYVMAARTLGARDRRVIWKHIFPNTLGTIITSSVLVIPSVIFSESMLSFLGIVSLGNSEGTSLGTLLSEASDCWQSYPHLLWAPAIVISLLMICFNLFGNGLRDAFNPSLRGVEE